MICLFCKNEIPDDSVFCPDCGGKQMCDDGSQPGLPPEDSSDNHDNVSDNLDNSTQGNESQSFETEDNAPFTKDGAHFYCVEAKATDNPGRFKFKWLHGNNCKGSLFLGDNAICLCHKCGDSAPVNQWQIASTDNNISELNIEPSKASEYDPQQAMYVAGEITTVAGMDWLHSFTQSLIDYIEQL